MQQKLRVLYKTFFYYTAKNSTETYGTYVGPVSLLFLFTLKKCIPEKWKKKKLFLYVIRSNAPC